MIRFYNFFIRVQKFILLNILFLYTLVQLIKIPFYFFFSFLFSNLYYKTNDLCDINSTASIPQTKDTKIRKTIFDRTLLNQLIRKSIDKKFVHKYFNKYVNDEVELEIKSDDCIKLAVSEHNFNDNVILINEVKSNIKNICFETHNSIRIENKTYLSLNNCAQINPNDGNLRS